MALEYGDTANITITTTTHSVCVKELIEEYKTPIPPKKINVISPEFGKSCEKDKNSVLCIHIIWTPRLIWEARKVF